MRASLHAAEPPGHAGVWTRVGQWSVLAAVLIAAGAIALRAHALDTRSFWFDEAFSWRVATFPVADMVGYVARDNHPPLYFLVLKLWMAVFGSSALALRLLSVLLGGATVLASYLVAAEAVAPEEGVAPKRRA